ncbi:MAG: hypothetical protein R2849_04370 [Thermomicrobiales bacterium]
MGQFAGAARSIPCPAPALPGRSERTRSRWADRLSRDPGREGNGLYLANHRPIAGSHPSMYDQRGRGYCAIVIPIDQPSTLLVTSPITSRT